LVVGNSSRLCKLEHSFRCIFGAMKTHLNFLLRPQREKILEAVEIIKEVVDPEMIILYGSYARGKWTSDVYQAKDGIVYTYESDFDFLVITKEPILKDYEFDFEVSERTAHFKQSVNVQVNDITNVNAAIEVGQYFYADVLKDGVLLFDKGTVQLATPRVLSSIEKKELAQQYFDTWFPKGKEFLETAVFDLSRGYLHVGAFLLHQATESLYYATLLVFTGYKPKIHNIYKLRKQAKTYSEELWNHFPILDEKRARDLFDLLKRAYIDSRYKKTEYHISVEEFNELVVYIEQMIDIVKRICTEEIAAIPTRQ
jgi:HEPN domain-containing protein/predicted nucleotidyltransferase